VLRQFLVVCLSVSITSLVFYGLLSNLNNIKISAGSASSTFSTPTIPLTVQATHYSNTNSINSLKNIFLKTEAGASLIDYQPISLLDIKPVVLKHIQANLSAIFDDAPHLEINCLLMINEYGDVDRILFGDNNLSEKYRSELEQLFLQLRFTPGYLHNQAVPTVMRIAISI
jgi:hypothetical protein